MRYFVVFLFLFFSFASFAQQTQAPSTVSATLIDDVTLFPIENVNIINVNTVKGTVSDATGHFTIEAKANDTLHISLLGYESIKLRVTNDWLKNRNATNIPLTQKAYTLEEVVVTKFKLTGFLPIDAKLAPVKDNYRYNIAGLHLGYEAGENSPNAFKKVVSSIFNPADFLHNIFGKKPAEMRRLREMKKDDTVRNALAAKFDRETLAALLGISKDEIPEILQNCNYSEDFIKEANDLQIMDAISGCYEEYKALNNDRKR